MGEGSSRNDRSQWERRFKEQEGGQKGCKRKERERNGLLPRGLAFGKAARSERRDGEGEDPAVVQVMQAMQPFQGAFVDMRVQPANYYLIQPGGAGGWVLVASFWVAGLLLGRGAGACGDLQGAFPNAKCGSSKAPFRVSQ